MSELYKLYDDSRSYVPGFHSSVQGVLLPFSVKVMRSEEGAH